MLVLPLALVVLVFAATDDGPPRTNADRVNAVAASLACPVCEGQSVAESEHPAARNIENTIRLRVDEGRTDDQIRAEIVADFGEFVDLRPPRSGVAGLVWVLPVLFGAGALAGLAAVFRRWRLAEVAEASAADRELVERYRTDADG